MVSAGVQGIPGLIDSPFDHWQVWDEIVKPMAIWGVEYQQLPRGRVIYDVQHKKVCVYLDKNLATESLKATIRNSFKLNGCAIRWLLDSHYTTNKSELQNLFLNDE